MKILHVITRLVHGGAQLNTVMCCAEQARRGHQVTLMTGTETGPEGSLLEHARQQGFRLIELPSMVRRLHPVLDALALLEIYRLLGEGFDVVHTHTSKAGILGRAAARLRRVPVVVHTPHGHIFHGYFNPAKERFFLLLERAAARLCHCQVMLTQGDLNDHLAARIGPEEHFLVIPSGVDLNDFAPGPQTPEALGLPPDRLLVGTVLRLVPVKGIFDLLDAFALVSRRFPDCHLAVAGDGPLRAEFEERVCALGLGDKITLLGHLQPVAPFLRTLKLFVLPSHNEGMGRAVVEAMAVGLPVLATRIGGLPDLVEEGANGRLVAPKSPDELAHAWSEMLASPEQLTAMGQASLRRAHAFSAEVMYDRLERLYDTLQQRYVKAL